MKEQIVILKVSDYTNLNIAVSSDEGDKINMYIRKMLDRYEKVTIDFSDIIIMTSAFLNAAIGQLYKDYTSEELASRIKLLNVSDDDLPLFKKVTNRAKDYFKDKKKFADTTNEILNGKL